MGFLHGVHRYEELLCPERLDDYIAAEHPVRFLDAFVDLLNLTTLGFQRVTPATTGRPAYPQLICCSCTCTAISTVSG
jgi:transposase